MTIERNPDPFIFFLVFHTFQSDRCSIFPILFYFPFYSLAFLQLSLSSSLFFSLLHCFLASHTFRSLSLLSPSPPHPLPYYRNHIRYSIALSTPFPRTIDSSNQFLGGHSPPDSIQPASASNSNNLLTPLPLSTVQPHSLPGSCRRPFCPIRPILASILSSWTWYLHR
ncbi:hypothetical protein BO85DRAFT_158729 [Aspergillus piperis CBS 112811]|uniref:Uncharacterized protein n=1 Tax=Aspergillus piperis CBS 112811 TaxID=1448313 RepID=A0A8G1QSQ1_9EURO|nr:hypothetical protein BO85DRAFT_158729 [Aspergillus piperis CBS 112811]RAH53158.1 hypothetical protein BO85DRAFT_158729 [Aspergillus piperis CBS 112811]